VGWIWRVGWCYGSPWKESSGLEGIISFLDKNPFSQWTFFRMLHDKIGSGLEQKDKGVTYP